MLKTSYIFNRVKIIFEENSGKLEKFHDTKYLTICSKDILGTVS